MTYRRVDRSLKGMKKKSLNNGEYKNNEKAFTRKGKMNFEDYVTYLAFQKGKTTSVELDEYLKNKYGTYDVSISKQAFSKQRLNIKPKIFIDLYKEYLIDFYTNYKEEVKTYKGYNVLAVDGSIFELPNTLELKEEYKTQKNNSGHEISARGRVSGIYDVENEFMIDAVLEDCGKSEKRLAKLNIEETGKILDMKKCIIIFDRGYPGIELIWYLEKMGAKYIIRLSNKAYKAERDSMKTNDEIVKLRVTGDRLKRVEDEQIREELKEKKTLDVRMTRVTLDTEEIEYLISNITNDIIPEEEMKEAYFKRWKIETGYDILKNKLHIENFTGKTKITLEQDFYAHIYTFNILQDIKHTATLEAQKKQKDKNLKYKYKTNINILAWWLKDIFVMAVFADTQKERRKLFDIVIKKAEKNLVAIKPNRSNVRNKSIAKVNRYKTNLRNNM